MSRRLIDFPPTTGSVLLIITGEYDENDQERTVYNKNSMNENKKR